jgi:hypothetical protein
MMEQVLAQIAQYFLWSVYINATTLLIIVGMIGYVLVQIKRDTREITRSVSDVATMTRDVAELTTGVVAGRPKRDLARAISFEHAFGVTCCNGAFTGLWAMARGEAECPGFFTQFEGQKQHSRICGIMLVLGRWGHHGLSPPW